MTIHTAPRLHARLLLALATAATLFIAAPSTALMAIVSVDNVCGADDGRVNVGYTYNDQTLVVQNLIINNDGTPGTVFVRILDANGASIFDDSLPIGGGHQKIDNIANLNLQMALITGPRGTALGLPYGIVCGYTAGR